MIQLKRFINLVRNCDPSTMQHNLGRGQSLPAVLNNVKNMCLTAIPFVFEEKLVTESQVAVYNPGEILDMPFKCIAFEIAEQDNSLLLITEEVTPGEYRILAHDPTAAKEMSTVITSTTDLNSGFTHDKDLKQPLANLLKTLLEIYKSLNVRIASETPREHIKIGRGLNKATRRINHVVRIMSKTSKPGAKALFSNIVTWSHQWLVRAHWRRVKYIGKDRENKPIPGFTWVRNHKKGPEGCALFKKTRAVTEFANKEVPHNGIR